MLKPFRCGHCKQRLVILHTETNSVLPVEIPEGPVTIEDELFNSSVHKSHLKNCIKLRQEWEEKKKKYLEKENPFGFLTPKELCK